MKESWRPVAGYGGKYSVSSEGRVRSEARKVRRPPMIIGSRVGHREVKEKIMAANPTSKNGRPRVNLTSGWMRDSRRVDHLVAEAFIGPLDGGTIEHIDGDKYNNRASNIRIRRQESELEGDSESGSDGDRAVSGEEETTERSVSANGAGKPAPGILQGWGEE